jgi:predicted RNA polymerase sigma factor
MSEHTARLVDRLRARLERTMRRVTLADAAFGTAVVVGTLAALRWPSSWAGPRSACAPAIWLVP